MSCLLEIFLNFSLIPLIIGTTMKMFFVLLSVVGVLIVVVGLFLPLVVVVVDVVFC